MTDPTNKIPHLLGITLDSNGVATSQVTIFNRNTGEYQTKATDANKVVIFDAAEFTSGYSASDVIDIQNVGASVGHSTITINSATGDFQEATLTCAAAATAAITL